jgi:hypothetical protein
LEADCGGLARVNDSKKAKGYCRSDQTEQLNHFYIDNKYDLNKYDFYDGNQKRKLLSRG